MATKNRIRAGYVTRSSNLGGRTGMAAPAVHSIAKLRLANIPVSVPHSPFTPISPVLRRVR